MSESHLSYFYEWESRAAKHVVIPEPRRYARAVSPVSRISTSRQIIIIISFYKTIILSTGAYRASLYTDFPTCKTPLIRIPTPRTQTHLPALDVLHNLPLSCVRRLLPSVRIPVALRQQEGDEVQPRPDLFALQFPNQAE